MAMIAPLLTSQKIVRVCLFFVAAIAVTGGALQLYLGQPETTARLDNVHRFMAGVYLPSGIIAIWAGVNIRNQSTLTYLLALAVFMGGTGRLISMSLVGVPEPHAMWLGYLIPELTIPIIMVVSQWTTTKILKAAR